MRKQKESWEWRRWRRTNEEIEGKVGTEEVEEDQ